MTIPAFIANPAISPAVNAAPVDHIVLANNGFFPDIDLADFHGIVHTDGNITESRVIARLQQAMRLTNHELHNEYCAWSQQGYETLADVPQATYGEGEAKQNGLVNTYLSAVYAKAMQLLLDRNRATDTTMHALPRADVQEKAASNYEIEFREALLMLQLPEGHYSIVEAL